MSTFTCPAIFSIADLIAEVYGYRIVKKIIWNGLFCQFIFGLFFTIIVNINFLNYSENIASFKIVFNDILKTNIVTFLAITCGMFINAIIISKLKLNMNGKLYWIRTIISSCISGAIVTFIGCSLLYLESASYFNVAGIFTIVSLYYTIFSIFISPFLSVIATKIKKMEGIDKYDYNVNYNPFKF